MKTVKNLLDEFQNDDLGEMFFNFLLPDESWSGTAKNRTFELLDKLRSLPLKENKDDNIIFIEEVKGEDEIFYDLFTQPKKILSSIKTFKISESDCKKFAEKYDRTIVDDFWKANEESGSGYSMAFTPWNEVLNYWVSPLAIERFGPKKVLVTILNEITFYGITESEIYKKKLKLEKAIKDIQEGKNFESVKKEDLWEYEPTEEELKQIDYEIIYEGMQHIMQYSEQVLKAKELL